MKQTTMHNTAVGRVMGFEGDISDLKDWRPTPEGVREVVMMGHVVGAHIGSELMPRDVVRRSAPTQNDVEIFAERADSAIRAGRLIDFGTWTNDVIKFGGNRGGPLYTKGLMGHPFRDDYLFMHGWDMDGIRVVAVYLVTPLEPDKPAGDCEVIELSPLVMSGERVLAIGDRLILEPARNEGVVDYKKYHCSCIPALWRYLPGAESVNPGSPESAAAGNVLDPLMTALMILSTRGIDRMTVKANDKLQRARRKNGKLPIPPYDRVHSAPYITAITAKIERRPKLAGLGGTHASPIAHLRMGHPRVYANGKTSLIADALVNFNDDARRAWLKGSRSHYVVKS